MLYCICTKAKETEEMYKIKDFNKSAENVHKFLRIISIIVAAIIIPIIIYNLTLMAKSLVNPDETPSFLGIKSLVIISESMEPNIMPNDAIFVKEVPEEDLKVGDVISFKDDGFINTHRIVEILNENGKIKYRTKGDNNKRNDRNLVSYVDIEGKYIFKIKGLGTFTEIIKNKVTLIGLLIILIVILIYQIRLNKRKLQRKEKRYKYNKKLLEEKQI